jgi:cytochrome c553
MKRIIFFLTASVVVISLANCHSSKKAQAAAAKINYDTNVQGIMAASCSPCHIPAKGGKKLPLDTYTAVKDNIDDIIMRIKLEPGQRGFMPMNHPKLSDSTIAVIEQWKLLGTLEK